MEANISNKYHERKEVVTKNESFNDWENLVEKERKTMRKEK
jgi:hypothetical protein